MTTPNKPVKEPHPKSPLERKRDQKRLKQASLLWWSQIVYELAAKACEVPGPPCEASFRALSELLSELNALHNDPIDPSALLNDQTDTRVALWWWARAIYQSADRACIAMQAYEYCEPGKCNPLGGDNPNFKFRRHLIRIFEKTAATLNGGSAGLPTPRRLDSQPPPTTPATNCSSDDECPDDYICVEGTCESVLPMD